MFSYNIHLKNIPELIHVSGGNSCACIPVTNAVTETLFTWTKAASGKIGYAVTAMPCFTVQDWHGKN